MTRRTLLLRVGVMERWEVVRAREAHREAHREDGGGGGEDPRQWRKLQADLRDVTSWLDAKLPELEALQELPPSTGLQDFEDNVRTLKVHAGVFLGLLSDFGISHARTSPRTSVAWRSLFSNESERLTHASLFHSISTSAALTLPSTFYLFF